MSEKKEKVEVKSKPIVDYLLLLGLVVLLAYWYVPK